MHSTRAKWDNESGEEGGKWTGKGKYLSENAAFADEDRFCGLGCADYACFEMKDFIQVDVFRTVYS